MADHARELFGISIRQACAWFSISTAMFYYERKPVDDGEVIDKLTELAERYPRYGFHKLFAIIRREGYGWNLKRVYRAYCEMKLNMRAQEVQEAAAAGCLSGIATADSTESMLVDGFCA